MTTRFRLSGRVFILAVCLLFVTFCKASALEHLECGGISIYYSDGEEEIGLRLQQKTPEILSYLEERGIVLSFPLHVIGPAIGCPSLFRRGGLPEYSPAALDNRGCMQDPLGRIFRIADR